MVEGLHHKAPPLQRRVPFVRRVGQPNLPLFDRRGTKRRHGSNDQQGETRSKKGVADDYWVLREVVGDKRQDSPVGIKTKTRHISPCSLKTCRHVVTVDGTYCMSTGVQLEGPKEVCFDFRASTTAIHHRVHKSQRESRRRRSVTKYFSKSTCYMSFEEAVQDIFGKSSKRKAAQRKVRTATIKAVAKLLHKPATLGSAMRAMMAAKQRPVISNGASEALIRGAAKAIWSLHKSLGLERTSYATIRQLSALFAATLVSKSGGAIEGIDGLLGTKAAPAIKSLADVAAIPEVYYSHFDISCRAMSKLWREIKSVAAAKQI